MTLSARPNGHSPSGLHVRKQAFLDYTLRAQREASITTVLEKHRSMIEGEMRRRGTWRPQARLLDLGCGLGTHTEFWQERGFRVTGLDHDADLIVHARQRAAARGLSIRYEEASADRLPFADGSFEIVYANSLLEHVQNWERCLDEWIRVAAPGGLLWVGTTNVLCPRQAEFRLPLYSWWPPALKRLAVRLALGPLPALANYSPCPALHWFSYFRLKRFLESRGMSVRDRFDCMDVAAVDPVRRMLRRVALSGAAGRWCCYLLVSTLVVLATKKRGGEWADGAIGEERVS